MNTTLHARRRLLPWIGLALLSLLLTASPALAAEGRSGDQVVIPADEVVEDDLYLSGESVVVDGTIKGDLVAAGSQVTINGAVEGDLVAVGQTVLIAGTVQDDMRVAAQLVQLRGSGRVGDDLIVAAASLEIQPESSVGGDLLLVGAKSLLGGAVAGDVQAGALGLELRGSVAGDMDVAVGGDETGAATMPFGPDSQVLPQVQPGLTLADGARVGGKLNYAAPFEARLSPAATIAGGVTRSETVAAAPAPQVLAGSPSPLWSLLRRYVTLLLVGLLVLWLLPVWFRRTPATLQARPASSIGRGALFGLIAIGVIIFVLIATIVLAVTLGVLGLGGLLGLVLSVGLVGASALLVALIMACAYLAPVIVGFWGGRWLLSRLQPAWNERVLPPLAIGLLVLVLVTAVPLVGAFLRVLIVLAGLGVIWLGIQPIITHPRTRLTQHPVGGVV